MQPIAIASKRLMSVDPREELVARLFTGTGPTYDLMVNLTTLGIDRLWKRRILGAIPPSPQRIADLACGTGIVIFRIARKYPGCQVVGVDITEEYLQIAREKALRLGLSNIRFLHARAEEAALEGPFDCVTSSYLAKYANLDRLTENVSRMLREGGRFITHEFTYPSSRLLASIWEGYFRLLQKAGSPLFPQWRTIFYELPNVVRRSAWLSDLTRAMAERGFSEIRVEHLTLQGSALVCGTKGRS